MKKYALYPGVGKVSRSDPRVKYIDGRQLAACYRIPYSECLDTSLPAIRKVMGASKAPIYLISLLPMEDGRYEVPTNRLNKLIITEGLMDKVNRNG